MSFKKFKDSLSGGVKWHNKSDKDREASISHARKQAGKSRESGLTNREFAEKSDAFKQACENASVQPTARQARKYRRQEGKAYAGGR